MDKLESLAPDPEDFKSRKYFLVMIIQQVGCCPSSKAVRQLEQWLVSVQLTKLVKVHRDKNVLFFRRTGLPLHADSDFSRGVVQGVEPALHEESPLHTECSDQEVESYTAEAVAFQEGHEKTKSNKDHHMDILEAWREGDRQV